VNFKELTQLGLTESEIKVYLALLELDSSTVGSIVHKAGVQESKIYQILDKLKGKGLVSSVIKGSYKHYQASDPINLIRLLNEKKRQIESEEEKISNELIPRMEAKRKNKEDVQEALVFEGFNGLKTAYNYLLDTMNPKEEYFVFNLGEELSKEESINFFTNYHKKRIEKNVKVRFIAPYEVRGIVKKNYSFKLMEHRFTQRKFPIGTIIFKNHVMTLSMKNEPTAFIIKSKANYEYYLSFFEDMWKLAKP
jgi:HTH-type transcriptional regulator, sugar sensing transcriptional regulator